MVREEISPSTPSTSKEKRFAVPAAVLSMLITISPSSPGCNTCGSVEKLAYEGNRRAFNSKALQQSVLTQGIHATVRPLAKLTVVRLRRNAPITQGRWLHSSLSTTTPRIVSLATGLLPLHDVYTKAFVSIVPARPLGLYITAITDDAPGATGPFS